MNDHEDNRQISPNLNNADAPRFSIIIPARDEERYIGACLDSILAAGERVNGAIEIIVAINRCTDRTEEIAQSYGAIVVREDAKNLSKIRNEAAKLAQGDILVFIDADSVMSRGLIAEIERKLTSGRYIGGGTIFKLDRISPGIFISIALFLPIAFICGIMCGVFWLFREAFEAVGGFNEEYLCGEDIEFAKRLKRLGKYKGKRFGIILKEHIVTSARKFDKLGDWFILRHPALCIRIFSGKNREGVDRLWYDFER